MRDPVVMPRRFATLACASVALIAAAPAPPAALAPYLADGRFDPGDFGWAKGGFADATPSERAAWTTLRAWLDRCVAAERARVRRELATMGVTDPRLDDVPTPGGTPCAGVGATSPPERLRAGPFAAFSRALAEARPVVESLRWSIALARNASDHDELRSRVVTDQMLRGAWQMGAGELPAPPTLSADAREVARSLIGFLTHETDAANAAWLGRRLAERGWPKVSDVGRLGANDAWLLAQHADADPALQLRALRAMEPLVAAEEADATAHAYLHDRVMLKLLGRQRYGTQLACVGGTRAPRSLEDADSLDARRAAVKLPPIATYLARTEKLVGPCPPGPAR